MIKRICLNIEQHNKLLQSKNFIKENATKFENSFSEDLKEKENTFSKNLLKENLSKKLKLIKIYKMADEIAHQAKEFIPCTKGCSSCCKINIQITPLEAELIQKETGIKAKIITKKIIHDNDKFLGIACPFLKNDTCSIYSVRPFVCRKHLHFDKDNYWCQIENMSYEETELVNFTYEEAYAEMSGLGNEGIRADIRDFFPNLD